MEKAANVAKITKAYDPGDRWAQWHWLWLQTKITRVFAGIKKASLRGMRGVGEAFIID